MHRFARRSSGAATQSGRESGQALLELALVAPILILLVMAIFQFSYVIQSQIGLTNAVREAARRVATSTNATPTWTGSGSLEEFVQTQLCGNTSGVCNGGLLKANVQAFDGTKLCLDGVGGCTIGRPLVSFCTYAAAGTTQFQVNVTVRYAHPVFFALMTYATDLIDGTPNGYWDLKATAQIRLENVNPTAPPPGLTCP